MTPELPRRPAAEKAQKNKPLFTGMLIIAYAAELVNVNLGRITTKKGAMFVENP